LPANLDLSFHDLEEKGFTISKQNRTHINVKGFKNKTRWNLDPITYGAPVITVIGGSAATPLNWFDVWNASNSNGWNVVFNNNLADTQFFINNTRVYFGNGTSAGTTYFNDTSKQITFNASAFSGGSVRLMEISRYSYLQFGAIEDLGDKTTSRGCSFIVLEQSGRPHYLTYGSSSYNTHTNFFSCSIEGTYRLYLSSYNSDYWNTNLVRYSEILDRSNCDIYNIYMSNSVYGILYPSATTTYDYLRIVEMSSYAFALRYTGAASNSFARNNNRLYYATALASGSVHNFTDCDFDSWVNYWGASSKGTVYRRNTFNITFTFPNGTIINGATTGARVIVQHYGNSSGVDYNATLATNGHVSLTLIVGYWTNKTGAAVQDLTDLYDYNPYRLQLTNLTGWIYDQNFTLSDTVNMVIAVQDPSGKDISAGFIGLVLTAGLFAGVFLIAFRRKKKRS